MFIVANRVYVKPDWQAQFEQRFHNRLGQIDKQPGFVRLQVLKPVQSESPYVVLTTWADENAFKNWISSEDFQLAHQNPLPKEAFYQEGALERHEEIISSDKPR